MKRKGSATPCLTELRLFALRAAPSAAPRVSDRKSELKQFGFFCFMERAIPPWLRTFFIKPPNKIVGTGNVLFAKLASLSYASSPVLK